MGAVHVKPSTSWVCSSGRVAVYAASGLVTPAALHRIQCEAAVGTAGANAFVFDCARAILALSMTELVAIALGNTVSLRLRRITGAWVVPLVNLHDCRQVTLQLATYGVARRVFTAYGPALAWAQEEAALRR